MQMGVQWYFLSQLINYGGIISLDTFPPKLLLLRDAILDYQVFVSPNDPQSLYTISATKAGTR